jgi:aminoglycoside phosphotransferase family enzyme
MKDNERSLPAYISSLLRPDSYDHPVENFQLIETHISWVILTGHFAYKIKKPINLGFLDFSTLEKRHYYRKEELRWIDTLKDVAFLMMDLHNRQHNNFAQLFLNAYLEKTGDYTAMTLLRFYLVYRAMVRAKVEAISASQMLMNSEEQREANQACYDYLELANSYLLTKKSMLIITCGMSASGKSTLTQQLVEKLAAIRL